MAAAIGKQSGADQGGGAVAGLSVFHVERARAPAPCLAKLSAQIPIPTQRGDQPEHPRGLARLVQPGESRKEILPLLIQNLEVVELVGSAQAGVGPFGQIEKKGNLPGPCRSS